MIGATFCSGIGAPEVAAPWIDWQLASEIEGFPREVLAHRFGMTDARHSGTRPRLWGDFTALRPRHFRGFNIPFPDLIVAGTPCQSFSTAGLRQGIGDDRGNLTLQFVRNCHAILNARSDGKLTVLWENVPGVLSDKGNAFGAFLGGMVGAVDALPSPDNGSWPREGMVQGPRARAAWAVLDAQWFGVAQRRRRVFVVFDFGGACDPAAVLFERDSLRGHTPPRREAGFSPAPTISARPTGAGGLGTDFDCDGGLIASHDPAQTLKAEGFDASGMIASAENGRNPQPGDPCHTLLSLAHAPEIMPQNSGNDFKVRRLTCRECERLQGFPDDHTMIPRHRRRVLKSIADELAYLRKFYPDLTEADALMLAADRPRYKALGNSMAVPCVAWILERIGYYLCAGPLWEARQ